MNLIHSILQLATLIPLTFCENCEPLTVSSCADAGYKLTARFYDRDGEPYQDALADMLNFYVPLLRPCSKYASTILCSLYLPKCDEGRRDAKPPCRKVCKQFVTDCLDFLSTAGLGGTFTTLCNFLPEEGQNSDRCFYPSNFRNSSSEGRITLFFCVVRRVRVRLLEMLLLCKLSIVCEGMLFPCFKYYCCNRKEYRSCVVSLVCLPDSFSFSSHW